MRIKGHLRPLVLSLLSSEKGMTGSELVQLIWEETGSKPSYGSVYPLLKDFREKGLVRIEKEGRRKIYRLTDKGLKEYGSIDEEEFLNFLLTALKIYGTVFDLEESTESGRKVLPELLDVSEILLSKEFSDEKRKEIRGRLEEIISLTEGK